MKDEAFVFQVEQIQAYPHIDRTFSDTEKCALTEIPLFTSMVGPTFAVVQKGSPYKQLLAFGLVFQIHSKEASGTYGGHFRSVVP